MVRGIQEVDEMNRNGNGIQESLVIFETFGHLGPRNQRSQRGSANCRSVKSGIASRSVMTENRIGVGIRELSLWESPSTDAGLRSLRPGSGLRRLSLGGSQITDVGLEHLEGFHSLRELHLLATAVTASGVESLLRALPKCRIVRRR